MTGKQLEIIFGHESKELENKIFVRDEDFEVIRGQEYKLSIEFLMELQKKLIGGQTVLEKLYFDNVSYWWFIYQSLIPELKNQLNFIFNFSNFLKRKNPSKVRLESNFERFDVIKQICDELKIDFSYSKFSLFKYNSKIKSKRSVQEIRYKKIHEKKIMTRKSLFQKNNTSIPKFSNKIVFAVSTNFRRLIFDFHDENFKRGEFITSNLANMFNKSELVGIDLDYTFQGNSSILLERFSENFSWIPLELFLNEQINDNTELIKKYKKLISDSNFQNLFSFMGIKFWNDLELFFQKMYFTPYLPFYATLVNAITKHFSNDRPKSVFVPYETGSLALAIITACSNLKITTLGIQHGHIYQYNPMYSYCDIRSESNPYGFPIPTYLLLFGNATKDLLLSNGYAEKDLIVFGNPSLFYLKEFQSKFNLRKSLKKFLINDSENIILFTTGKLQRAYPEVGNYDYDEKIAEQLIEKFGGNQNYKIIIKPHPTEQNIQVYEELIKKRPSENVIISHDNIFELISLSSLVVSVFSTTMYDALCFEKPVLRIEFSENQQQVIDLSQVITTTTLGEMSSEIISLLENFDHRVFSKKSKVFVKEQFGLPEEYPEKVLKSLIGY